ncbi:hypothetical protein A9Q81_15810 [Gammaproteobacteria bacterium 42_54_T18]|nr:hypothetical protein A9Q81_15810 [Gammaproteobacteria bacterium 42_54_T18]
MFFRFIWVFFLLSVNVASFANVPLSDVFTKNTVSLTELADHALRPQVWYFEDKEGDTSLDKAQRLFESGQFGITSANFNFGFSNSPYWVYLAFSIEEDKPQFEWKDILFEFNYPHIDDIQIYRSIGQGKPQLYSSLGDHRPFAERMISDSVFVIPDVIKMNDTYHYWIRLETTSSMMLLISIWDKDNYIEEKNHRLLAYGIYYGILIVMMFYNMFIGFSIKDRSYLYYVGYIASFTVFQACLFGHAYQYFWPTMPRLNELVLPASVLLCLMFAVSFSRSFLQIDKQHPRINIMLLVIILFCSVSLFLSFFVGYRISILLAVWVGFCAVLSILIAAVNSLLTGFRGAKLFLVAWVTLLFASFVMGLTASGVLPANIFTRHVAQFGSALEVILLSLALADRINRIKSEKRFVEKQSKLKLEEKNRELNTAMELLKKSNALKDEFLATISHELRTPMNGIEGSLQVIQDGNVDGSVKPHVDAAAQSANRMTQLVDSLLEYSEIQSGHWHLHEQPFVLDKLVGKCGKMIESDCSIKGITFSVINNTNLQYQLIGDSLRLHHMLFQLLDNAVKFTHQGSITLTIDSHEKESGYQLSFVICDTGIGIATDTLKDIFESFRQMDGSFSRQYGGLGIGLSLCKAIVDRMGGGISVESVLHEGTAFTIAIDVYKGSALEKNKKESDEYLLLGNPLILIVEDNPVNQMTLTAMIEKFGCRVEKASNGQEAVEMANKKEYDCILMDCQMPILDGFEATKSIRKMGCINSETHIIAVTANAMSGDRDRCLESGMDDYIRKPIKKDLVFEKMHYWLIRDVT